MKTISYDDETLFDRQMFFKLRDHILASYPKINDQLELEIVNDMTLLFAGKDQTLALSRLHCSTISM
ncbi:MAG: hypothetical protein CMK43_09395 [Porticoccaceae bacterium]|nr:hypothetical protein [Porticoccaceae bacterium]